LDIIRKAGDFLGHQFLIRKTSAMGELELLREGEVGDPPPKRKPRRVGIGREEEADTINIRKGNPGESKGEGHLLGGGLADDCLSGRGKFAEQEN